LQGRNREIPSGGALPGAVHQNDGGHVFRRLPRRLVMHQQRRDVVTNGSQTKRKKFEHPR
jgi:hypothetical protein